MKIDGPGNTGKLGGSKKAGKAAASDGAAFSRALRDSSNSEDQETDTLAGMTSGGALGSVDALLALQGVDGVDTADPDGRARNRAAVTRGEDLLDRLEDIRTGLLTGRLDQGRLLALRDALASKGEAPNDPKIQSILADIELRVAVELAKHGS